MTPHFVRPDHHPLPTGSRDDGIGHDATITRPPKKSTAPPGLWAPAPEVVVEKAKPKTKAPAVIKPRSRVKPDKERKIARVATCGTRSGYDRHQRNGEKACDPCRLAVNAAKREYEQRRKGRPPVVRERPPCGTWQGRKAHRWRKEEPCEPCVMADRAYQRERHFARKAKAAEAASSEGRERRAA